MGQLTVIQVWEGTMMSNSAGRRRKERYGTKEWRLKMRVASCNLGGSCR